MSGAVANYVDDDSVAFSAWRRCERYILVTIVLMCSGAGVSLCVSVLVYRVLTYSGAGVS